MSVAFLPKYSSFKKHFPPIKITLCCCWFFFFYHLCWSSISYTEQKRKRDHFPSVSCPGYSHHPLNEKKQRFFVQTASLDDPHPPEHFKILIPFIHSLLLIIIRVAGGLESIPATKGREVGYALWTDRLSVTGPL